MNKINKLLGQSSSSRSKTNISTNSNSNCPINQMSPVDQENQHKLVNQEQKNSATSDFDSVFEKKKKSGKLEKEIEKR